LDRARSNIKHDVLAFLETQLEFVREAREVETTNQNGQMDVAMGTIKLMAAANPASLMVIDGQGQIPLHIACRLNDLDIVKSLVEANEECLMIEDSNQDLPLHIACRLGKCDIVSYLSTKPESGAIVKDNNGYLLIQLLLSNAECNRNT
jgi:ankyrin repeat protein